MWLDVVGYATVLSHPTSSYRSVSPAYSLLSHPSYPVLPLPTPSYLILPSLTHPTLDASLNHPTLSGFSVMIRHQLSLRVQTTTLVSVQGAWCPRACYGYNHSGIVTPPLVGLRQMRTSEERDHCISYPILPYEGWQENPVKDEVARMW